MNTIRSDRECQLIAESTGIDFSVWRNWFRLPDAPKEFRVAMQMASLKSMTRRVGACSDVRWFIYPSKQAVESRGVQSSHSKMEKARAYKVMMWSGASKVRSERIPSVGEERKQVGGGARGKVSGYSPASRARLQRRLAEVKNIHLSDALFITLTYPAKYPNTETTKRHLRAFIKRIRARFPDAAIGWRLEYQRRKAPHYHLLLLGVKFIHSEVVARWWYEVVGSGDEKHLRAGTEIKRVRSAKHAAFYISKYMSKSEDGASSIPEGEKTGRFWGFEGRMELYTGEIIEIVITGEGHVSLCRFMRSLISAQYRKKGKRHKDRPPAIGCSRSWFGDVDAIMRGVASVSLA